MQGKGAMVTHQHPNFTMQSMQNLNTDMQQQVTMSTPMTNAKTLSDQTIATLALNTHKSGSVMGMQWANECVDPNLRMYHVNGANMCQEMAYEIWTWMNQNGYYQPPTFNTQQTAQMTGMFQPMSNMQQPMQQMQTPMSNYSQGNLQ